jgi:acetyltransferase-like isoleucine patch superfamily enzyme
MGLKELAKKLAYGPKATSDSYIVWLRSKGMVIGDNCAIYAPTKTCIDVQNPWMIEMGDNVQITEGVTILTHGYDWSVFKGKYGDVLGSAGHVKIGSNVFIGMKATILKGTTIGDNVVIGANSLINKDVPSDCVVAGNPQRIICSIDEYLEKRRNAQLAEALDLYKHWRSNSPEGKRGEMPRKELFREFFWLFEKRGKDGFDIPEYENVMALCGTYDKSVARYSETMRHFDSYEEFLSYLESHTTAEC